MSEAKGIRREHLNGLNMNVYRGTAFFGSCDSGQRILIGADIDSAYLDAVQVWGPHFRKDLGQEVVVMSPKAYAALLVAGNITSAPFEPAGSTSKKRTELKPVPYVGRRRKKIFEEADGKLAKKNALAAIKAVAA